MGDFWSDAEAIIHESCIKVPYSWQAGETASYFLTQLRDEGKIWGKKCPCCKKVLVPPRKSCPFCFVATDQWTEVSDEGVVESFTVVRRDTIIQPKKAPFAYALIRLDGADTGLVHVLGEVEPEAVREGMRVKAVLADDRKGSLLDIAHFKPVGS
ncbi:MAG: Zn-ribbon domain-containing OB-fold protein [Deltaproteobacteria bacterium]|nr:MAG: Zn-ribbon domain-containing OB-fold protein [Deltaproteobacteria bacterium]